MKKTKIFPQLPHFIRKKRYTREKHFFIVSKKANGRNSALKGASSATAKGDSLQETALNGNNAGKNHSRRLITLAVFWVAWYIYISGGVRETRRDSLTGIGFRAKKRFREQDKVAPRPHRI
ncbi:MAG: hypothetical protein ACWGMZ_03960 [Thermoguttaceae bacterium]